MAGIQNQGCPPSALAGAMMKDKKPFTYTPGGLDLSEISSQGPEPQKMSAITGEVTGAPVQSRSFRVLQNVLDTHDPAETPNLTNGAPMKIQVPLGPPPNVKFRETVKSQPGSYTESNSFFASKRLNSNFYANKKDDLDDKKLADIFKAQARATENNNGGSNNPQKGGYIRTLSNGSNHSEPTGPVHIPKVHSSSSIQHSDRVPSNPSRQDGVDATNGPLEEYAAAEPKKYMGGNIPSRSFRMLQAMTDDDDVTGTKNPETEQKSSDNSLPNSRSSSLSRELKESMPSVTPSYATKDNRIYRKVEPTVNLTRSSERIVNSALSNSREPNSPRSWNTSSRSQSPFSPTSGPNSPSIESTPSGLESPKLIRMVKQNNSKSRNVPNGSNEIVYEVRTIPFDDKPQTNYENGDKNYYFTNTDKNDKANNGKNAVLSELTSQFDSLSHHKKPKAAPGRIFGQLQKKYDTNEIKDEDDSIPCYQGSRFPSASFRYLQSKYTDESNDESNNNTVQTTNSNSNGYSRPTFGKTADEKILCPGKTFKSLQANPSAHPSIFEARRQKQQLRTQ